MVSDDVFPRLRYFPRMVCFLLFPESSTTLYRSLLRDLYERFLLLVFRQDSAQTS